MYIQNEYCEGGSLQNRIQEFKDNGTRFSEQELKKMIMHVAKVEREGYIIIKFHLEYITLNSSIIHYEIALTKFPPEFHDNLSGLSRTVFLKPLVFLKMI